MEPNFSLAESAIRIRGDASPASIKWLMRRLRHESEPHLEGYKVGHWRMTQSQIEAAIRLCTPKRVVVPEVPQVSSMTATSKRRLAG